MGYCKDCKFWESHTDEYRTNQTWRTCEAVGWRAGRLEKISDDAFALYAEANDDSGLDVGLKTGPLFGCIKFTAKE